MREKKKSVDREIKKMWAKVSENDQQDKKEDNDDDDEETNDPQKRVCKRTHTHNNKIMEKEKQRNRIENGEAGRHEEITKKQTNKQNCTRTPETSKGTSAANVTGTGSREENWALALTRRERVNADNNRIGDRVC